MYDCFLTIYVCFEYASLVPIQGLGVFLCLEQTGEMVISV